MKSHNGELRPEVVEAALKDHPNAEAIREALNGAFANTPLGLAEVPADVDQADLRIHPVLRPRSDATLMDVPVEEAKPGKFRLESPLLADHFRDSIDSDGVNLDQSMEVEFDPNEIDERSIDGAYFASLKDLEAAQRRLAKEQAAKTEAEAAFLRNCGGTLAGLMLQAGIATREDLVRLVGSSGNGNGHSSTEMFEDRFAASEQDSTPEFTPAQSAFQLERHGTPRHRRARDNRWQAHA